MLAMAEPPTPPHMLSEEGRFAPRQFSSSATEAETLRWAYAGLWPLAGLVNFRWSRRLTPSELLRELEVSGVQSRPVNIHDEVAQQPLLTFASTHSAAEWVRSKFACADEIAATSAASEVLITSSDLTPEEAGAATAAPPKTELGQATVTMQYMRGDARFLPLPGMELLAEKNPLRWSKSLSPSELAEELGAIAAQHSPVKISIEPAEERRLLKFASLHEACQYIHQHYPCGAACTEATSAQQDSPSQEPETEEPPSVDTAQAESDQVLASAKMQYMWGDARLFPLPGMNVIAESNPLRWSKSLSPSEVATELEAHSNQNRPVKISTESAGGRTLHSFTSVHEASQWIHRHFPCKGLSVEVGKHLCVICLSAPVEVMLMPCRHAVLCDACMQELIAHNSGDDCPVCRSHVTNHAHGSFAEDYVHLVEAAQARMERTQAYACEGMYNHIRPLMMTGAVSGAGAVACFVLLPPAAPVGVALAGTAFVVGYLPWFATTVASFEREDLAVAEENRPTSFITREDFARPLTLTAKVLTMAVAGPVSAITFFIPYALYAGVVRPGSRAALHALVRAGCFSYAYGLRPAAAGIHSTSVWLGKSSLALARSVHTYIVLPSYNTLCFGAKMCYSASVSMAHFIHRNVLTPSFLFLQLLARSSATGAHRFHDALMNFVQLMRTRVLSPSWKALCRALTVISLQLQTGAEITCTGVASGARMLHDYVLLPAGRVVVRGAEMAYAYVIVPSGKTTLAVVRMLANGIMTGASLAYNYILAPSGRAAWTVVCMSANGIATGAALTYNNLIVPIGKAGLVLVRIVARGIAAGATNIYTHILVRSGRGGCAIAYALAKGITTVAQLAYSHAIVPIGRGFSALACLTIAGVVLTHNNVIAPLGRVVWACGAVVAQGAMRGAEAMYIYILLPCGKALGTTASALCQMTIQASAALAQLAAAGGATVYVYVIRPGGEAAWVAVAATGQNICSLHGELQRSAREAYTAAREAGRETVQSLRNAGRRE